MILKRGFFVYPLKFWFVCIDYFMTLQCKLLLLDNCCYFRNMMIPYKWFEIRNFIYRKSNKYMIISVTLISLLNHCIYCYEAWMIKMHCDKRNKKLVVIFNYGNKTVIKCNESLAFSECICFNVLYVLFFTWYEK